jgi:hypothetical protein
MPDNAVVSRGEWLEARGKFRADRKDEYPS